ncbi:DEAD/DEAH box helicase [Apibacter muscae]|uniref:DEAD-box ATP-dependent RNA helicase RhpA n=1 Tax=Apibacter muscae TaxID=2509004 RepID=A0A563D8S5_9FLAO|nr:DEAD/DEAH box helicase [Apibacter muscae]TWP26646.1 DEAD/DEAH box helicase [Apibacter muscae]TWP28220.1 DEAD/DEAH box helicase [Apibacter muscae]
MTFEKLNLVEPILRALKDQNYINPTPIQAQAIPILLEGKDLLGVAQTGTGKTAAFSIPIIQQLHQNLTKNRGRNIKALILTPTRELAIQIEENIKEYSKYTNLCHTVIFGGVPQKKQTDTLRSGVDILIATPGRLLDLINQKFINLKTLEYFVLDEADQMLDMGFIHDIKKILPLLPNKRQSLFFSATMPPEIEKLANNILNHPSRIEVTPVSSTVDKIEQSLYYVEKTNKIKLLIELLQNKNLESILVFAKTKHGSDKISKQLNQVGIRTEAIHGNKSQNARQNALKNFKDKSTRVLIATDIAARGIDVDHLSHVFNYDLPNVPETYVHRIGRTGRAGRNGVAIAFCDHDELPLLKDIHKLIKKDITIVKEHTYRNDDIESSFLNNFKKKENNFKRNFKPKNKKRSLKV